jgi:hypothetical protein
VCTETGIFFESATTERFFSRVRPFPGQLDLDNLQICQSTAFRPAEKDKKVEILKRHTVLKK